jgi:hypothetical protein
MFLIGGDMEPRSHRDGTVRRLLTLLLAGISVYVLGSAAVRAAVILSVQSVNADAGSSGNALDVELTNSGPDALAVGGFSFGIVTANPNISFTDAGTLTTAAYVFAGNSIFGPDLTGLTSGQSLIASDAFNIPLSGISLSSGNTVGLGHILFDVSPLAAAGTFPVNLEVFPMTSLSDPSGNTVNIDSLLSGQITISGAEAVPEPSSLVLFFAGALFLGTGLLSGRASRINNRGSC